MSIGLKMYSNASNIISLNLPIVLVSVADPMAGVAIISDMIHGEAYVQHKYGGAAWELNNKYYRTNIFVLPCIDGETPPTNQVEAHIIYLMPEEDEKHAQERVQNIEAEIKILATRCAPTDAIRRWSTDAHYELVSLDPASWEEDDEDEAPDAHGVPRLKAALHAHAWPNLKRHSYNYGGGRGAYNACGAYGAEAAGAASVEQFASLLASLQQLGQRARRQQDEQRRRGAAAAVAGVLRALAEPGDDLLDADLLDDAADLLPDDDARDDRDDRDDRPSQARDHDRAPP